MERRQPQWPQQEPRPKRTPQSMMRLVDALEAQGLTSKVAEPGGTCCRSSSAATCITAAPTTTCARPMLRARGVDPELQALCQRAAEAKGKRAVEAIFRRRGIRRLAELKPQQEQELRADVEALLE